MGLLKTIFIILGIVIFLGIIVKFDIFGLGNFVMVVIKGFGIILKKLGELISGL